MWSCGVVLYTMLVGRYPFQSPADENTLAQGVVNMLKKMKNKEYVLPDSLGLTAPCVSLLRRLLEPDENARIRMEEIMQVGGGAVWWAACGGAPLVAGRACCACVGMYVCLGGLRLEEGSHVI